MNSTFSDAACKCGGTSEMPVKIKFIKSRQERVKVLKASQWREFISY